MAGVACGWRCRRLLSFRHLLSQPCPHQGSSVTPQSPGLAASAGGPVPTPHSILRFRALLTCPGEESVVSSQRPSCSSERTAKVFLNCFHFVLEGVSLSLFQFKLKLFPTLPCFPDSPARAVRRSPPRVPEGSGARVSCILEFSTYLFPNPPSPPQAFSPRVPGTETS